VSKKAVVTNNRMAVLTFILVSYAMIVLDVSIVSTALPKIPPRYDTANWLRVDAARRRCEMLGPRSSLSMTDVG
jgi:hypothetical protein